MKVSELSRRVALTATAVALSAGTAIVGASSSEAAQPGSSTPVRSAVIMSTSDGQLSDSDSSRDANGKFAAGSATYTRSTNKLVTNLHVTTPYLFVGARGTLTATVYADTPWGPYPLWSVSKELTACGLWDPTCSSSPAQTWKDTPSYWDAQKVQQYASYVDVTVSVS